MKVDMKNTNYYKSGKHTANVLLAREKALQGTQKKKQERIQSYNEVPTLCGQCGETLPYEKRKNKFCSSSCAATYNNGRREKLTEETKSKISKSLKKYREENPNQIRYGNFCEVIEITCKVCGTICLVGNNKKNRKTCGHRDCVTHASVGMRTYQNGSRKPVWYYNPYEGKDVLLESSWEVAVADRLIEKDIAWIRPEPIKWHDDNNVSRLYYPDFHLTEYNLYLDPKNPYCMEKDKEKLSIVSKSINLKYGSLEYMMDIIDRIQH